MTELHASNTDGLALEQLIRRSHTLQAELRARGKAIDDGDPQEVANLRRGLTRYMRGLPDNHRRTSLFGLRR